MNERRFLLVFAASILGSSLFPVVSEACGWHRWCHHCRHHASTASTVSGESNVRIDAGLSAAIRDLQTSIGSLQSSMQNLENLAKQVSENKAAVTRLQDSEQMIANAIDDRDYVRRSEVAAEIKSEVRAQFASDEFKSELKSLVEGSFTDSFKKALSDKGVVNKLKEIIGTEDAAAEAAPVNEQGDDEAAVEAPTKS